MKPLHSRLALLLLGVGCAGTDPGSDESPGTTTLELTIVTAATPGWSDPDGYQVVVDALILDIGVNGVLEVPSISAGNHTVTLRGLAPNCQVVNASNPQYVTAEPGTPLKVSFPVDCHTPGGGVNVNINFTGPGMPSDSLLARLDGGSAISFGWIDTARFAPVQAGWHTLVIEADTTTCLPKGLVVTWPVRVDDQPVNLAIPVSCYVPAPGSIQVNMQTAVINWPGVPGFRVALDDTLSMPIPGNGAVVFPGVPPGTHTLQVSAPFPCGSWFLDGNRKTVVVSDGARVTVLFREICIG
jgi:hypothetical protein